MVFMKRAFQTKEHNAMRTKLISKLIEMCASNFFSENFGKLTARDFRSSPPRAFSRFVLRTRLFYLFLAFIPLFD